MVELFQFYLFVIDFVYFGDQCEVDWEEGVEGDEDDFWCFVDVELEQQQGYLGQVGDCLQGLEVWFQVGFGVMIEIDLGIDYQGQVVVDCEVGGDLCQVCVDMFLQFVVSQFYQGQQDVVWCWYLVGWQLVQVYQCFL